MSAVQVLLPVACNNSLTLLSALVVGTYFLSVRRLSVRFLTLKKGVFNLMMLGPALCFVSIQISTKVENENRVIRTFKKFLQNFTLRNTNIRIV